MRVYLLFYGPMKSFECLVNLFGLFYRGLPSSREVNPSDPFVQSVVAKHHRIRLDNSVIYKHRSVNCLYPRSSFSCVFSVLAVKLRLRSVFAILTTVREILIYDQRNPKCFSLEFSPIFPRLRTTEQLRRLVYIY